MDSHQQFGVPGQVILQQMLPGSQPCWVALPLMEVRPSLFRWPCLPGCTALPHAAFKMLSACQAAVPEPQLTPTSCSSPPRALGPRARQSRASCNAAPSSVRLVVRGAPVTQEHFKLVSCTCLCCTSQHNQNQSIIIIIYVNKINK